MSMTETNKHISIVGWLFFKIKDSKGNANKLA